MTVITPAVATVVTPILDRVGTEFEKTRVPAEIWNNESRQDRLTNRPFTMRALRTSAHGNSALHLGGAGLQSRQYVAADRVAARCSSVARSTVRHGCSTSSWARSFPLCRDRDHNR